MFNLFARIAAFNRAFLIACALLLGVFQFILCAVVASINIESALEQVIMFAPPVLRALIEQTMLGASTPGVLAFGWNHPITHAIMIAVAITLATRAIAGEVDNGTIELILAQPLSRSAYLACHVGFGVLAIGAVAGAGSLGTLIGQRVFGLEGFGAANVGGLLLNVVLLNASIHAVTLLVSAWGSEAGRVATAGVLIAVGSYLVSAIAALWPKAAFMRWFSLHSYCDPREVLVGHHLALRSVLVLSAVIVMTLTVTNLRFVSRDLP